MRMYCRSVFVLLTLFAAVVISQDTQACIDATAALAANQPCFSAFTTLGTAVSQNTSISGVNLNMYCAQSCRGLVNRILTCDGDPDSAAFVSLNEFICSVGSDGVSCYDFFLSARFRALQNELDTTCPDNIPDGQMCDSACQTAFQNFVIDGGCCIAELFEFVNQFAGEELEQLQAQCPVDLSRGGTCTEIGGGATGLKAFVSVLLFAIIIAVAAI